MNKPEIATLILLLLVSSVCGQRKESIQFKHLSVGNGLSVSNVNCLLQDSKGFMWFGTSNGLNKYDGYNFSVYYNNSSDSLSIGANTVNDVVEDKNGDLWIGTFQGLNRYDRKSDSFTRYKQSSSGNSIISNAIQCLLLDDSNNLWIGSDRGLTRFEISKNKFTRYSHSNEPGSLSNDDISVMLQDRKGRVWIGTRGGGMDEFDPVKNSFIHHQIHGAGVSAGSNDILDLHEDEEGNILTATQEGLYIYERALGAFKLHLQHTPFAKSAIFRVEDDGDGALWIGIENAGIYKYTKRTKVFQHATNTSDPASLSSNAISSIYKDRAHNIWISTYTGGVNVYESKEKPFVHYKHNITDQNSVNHNSILAFAESKDGIWIGTDGGGLDLFDITQKVFTHHTAGADKQNSISGNNVGCLFIDVEGNVWSGSWGEGINVLPSGTQKFKHFRNDVHDSSTLSSNYCFDIYQDHAGSVWVGTMGAGLNLFDKESGTFKRYLPSPNKQSAINSKLVYSIYEDSASKLWIGTEDSGLNLFDPKSNEFQHYSNDEHDPKSLSNNTVNVMIEDQQGSLWIGTNGGLNKFDDVKKSFEVYTEVNGLASRVIKSMEIDSHGNLWLGTSRGISKFNPETKTFRNYTLTDGLQDYEFNRQASLKTKNGEMYFGGNNGFNSFYPDSVKDSAFQPPVVITNFLIFNKPVSPRSNGSVLTENVNEVEEVVLSYTQSIFSIEFAALDCIRPEEIKYAYMLEGVDKGWNYIDNKRSATYTQLDPGNYTFLVKAGNTRGEWISTPRSLKLRIIPPFWATPWFRSMMVLLSIGAVVAFVRIRLYTIKKQKELLEQTVIQKNLSLQNLVTQQEKLLKEKEWLIREIHHRVKNNFHMVTALLGTQAGYLKNEEALRPIEESQQRIYAMSLIHQKLYQSENLSAINMADYIHELVEYLKDSFEKSKKIRFNLQIERITLDLTYSLPVGLILNEAITNAMKYAFTSLDNGIISIGLKRVSDEQIMLSISDNGNGLPTGFDILKVKSMGLNLMKGLSDDINGIFTIEGSQGTRITLCFKPT